MAGDNAVATGAARTTARGIVLAGDRTDSRTSARSHSRTVRLLKTSLPLVGAAIFSIYGLSILKTTGWGSGIAALAIPQILPENLAMQNPHYEGFNKDGGRYWVKAESAQQDLKAMSLIKLNGISGELTDAKKLRTVLTAKRGTFDNKANVLELYDAIDVSGDAGIKARLTRASINTKDIIITSNEPVVVMMEAGTIKANQMTARQKVKEYTFVDDVRTHLNARDAKPEDAAQTPTATASDTMIGQSNAPIDIASNRLDVDDAKKIALFTGTVTAIQDGASLTTPELEVSYEGTATPQSGATAEGAGGKLKRMIAKNPVVMTQANGDSVTAQNADFDPIAKRAVLDGDVIMTQAPDKRATADKAEIDQSTKTIFLTGDVIVTQGQNVLKGQRLTFNQGNSRMQLTSPGASGTGGRVTAHFQQPQNGNARAPKPEAETQQGIAFGATFKTDPGAPVDIDAAKLDVDDAAKQAVFSGDVRAIQGDFVIKAGELTATYSGSAGLTAPGGDAKKQTAAQLSRIKAKTKVLITSKDGQNATGDWADFDTKANMATLGGNVVLTQGKNIVRGTKLVIDMTTGESVIKTEAISQDGRANVSADGTATTSTNPSSRPSAVFYPGDLKPAPDKKKAKDGDGWQAKSAP